MIIDRPGKARTFDTLSETTDVRYACVDYTARSVDVTTFDEELYNLGGGWFQYHNDHEYPISHLLAVIAWKGEDADFFVLKYADIFPAITTASEIKPIFAAIDWMLEINPLYGILQDPLYIATRLMQYSIRTNK